MNTHTNFIHREDVGFDWPKNTFVDGCKAASGSHKNKMAKRELEQKRQAKKMKKAKRSWLPFS